MSEAPKPRPEFRNLNLFHDVMSYRLPPAAWASILHRISGFLMVVLLPFVIWLFDKSVSSEISFGEFSAAFSTGVGILPAWFIKLATLVLMWSFLLHIFAGIRHLYLDVTHRMTKDFGRHSANAVFIATIILGVIFGAKLFGLY